MTDYKKLKLITTCAPHIRGTETSRSIMFDVIIALLPALAYACYWFGLDALNLTGVSVAACIFWEWLYRLLARKPQAVGDLSAVVTGVLLSFVCPANITYWQIIAGTFFAIVVAKQFFGGIGRNLINPALAGRVFMVHFGTLATERGWLDFPWSKVTVLSQTELADAAAPLSYMSGENIAATFRVLTEKYSLLDMFLGKIGGSMGEICTLALLAGGFYLVGRKIISWHIPASYILTVAALTFLFPRGGADNLQWMMYSLCGGGLMLGAFFMATDYSTSPIMKGGQLVYGIGCGLLTVVIRYFGPCEEVVYYAIMTMNCLTPLIDRCDRPVRFGTVKSGRSTAK